MNVATRLFTGTVATAACLTLGACVDTPTAPDPPVDVLLAKPGACPDHPSCKDDEDNGDGAESKLNLEFDSDVAPTDIDGDGSDDLILADPQKVPGTVAGSTEQADLTISADGTYALVVTDVAKIDPEVGTECDEDALVALREETVLGSLLTGDFSLDLDQSAGEFGFELRKASLGEDTWDLVVFRTVNQPALEVHQSDNIEVTLQNAKIILSKNRKGKGGRADFSIACRVNLHMVAELM